MACCSSRSFSLMILTVAMLLASQRSEAQTVQLAQPSPTDPKAPEPAATPRKLSKEGLNDLIEMTFGKGSAEMRRPIRVWLPNIATALTAEKATIAKDGRSVQFHAASAFFAESSAEVKVFRGDTILVFADQPVTQLGDLIHRTVTFDIYDKNVIITVTPEVVAIDEKQTVADPGGETQVVRKFVQRPGADTIRTRFNFRIDPKAPLAELLPAQIKTPFKLPPWTNEDLTKVPELAFGQPISKALPRQKALELTAHSIAKINHLNLTKTDGFMLALMEQRGDLRGLPFLMGDECRTRQEQAQLMATYAGRVRAMTSEAAVKELQQLDVSDVLQQMLKESDLQKTRPRANRDLGHRAMVAAVTQILMPESEPLRIGMARFLAEVPHLDATRALARLAIFAPEETVRAAAIDGLRLRREQDYAEILLQGFRYPLPAVSKRAAEALVKLERKDLLANLIEVLESPDPRLPATVKRDGNEVAVVREVVKVNHHKNCLLCHAPGNTDSTPDGVLKVAVPLPGEPMPKPAETEYYSKPSPTPDIVVRIDMTYLRQDFSLMMPVSDAHPWPDMQRFDFLVRTRTLTAAEAKAYEPENEPGRLSPYHRAALFALRELTGRDTEPTAVAWRKLLKLPKTAS